MMGGYDPTIVVSGLNAAAQINGAFPVIDLAIFVSVAMCVLIAVLTVVIEILRGR
jgi:hypothetical protein